MVLVATEEFLAEMDEDMEVMQGTVYLMQQQLKDTRERLQKYECCAATGAAPFPSLDAPTSQNSSVGDEVCREEASTKTELALKVEIQDKSSISETDSAVVTCQDAAVDGAREVEELSGRQTLNEVEAVGVNLDDVVDRDGENHNEFSACANDALAGHNSGLRTSPVEPSDLVGNLPMSDSFSGDSDSKSDVVCVDADLPCHKLRLVGRKNSDVLTDAKVNGLNTLVPVTEEND